MARNRAESLLAADLFCGAGGTSTGLLAACRRHGVPVNLSAYNHWTPAVATHAANHPGVKHYRVSLNDVWPRKAFPQGLDVLWASPACQGHSTANTGDIDDETRATAHCITRWAEETRPSFILVENVPNFRMWGPLKKINGAMRRDPERRGEIFEAWLGMLRAMGYAVEHRVLCAADFGAPTSRKRLFIQAARPGFKVVWPTPTHGPGRAPVLTTGRDVIDWSLTGSSIFTRTKPLVRNTLDRIYYGLETEGLKPFSVDIGNTSKGRRAGVHSLDRPLGTVMTKAHQGLVRSFLIQLRGTSKQQIRSSFVSLDEPVPTITAGGGHGGGHLALVQPYLIQQQAGGKPVASMDDPIPTITASGAHALVTAFITKHGPGMLDGAGDGRRPVVTVGKHTYALEVLYRMLDTHELAAGQGFPPNYVFTGTKTEQVCQIGNAVPPQLADALVSGILPQLTKRGSR